ncbi:MAG: hypothetical protein AB2693_21385, partial [Candidatus Thiodiazotropha sp.]
MAEKKSEGKKILDSYSRRISMIEHAITDRRASRKLLDSSVQEVQSEIHEVTHKLIDLLKSEERTLMQTLKNIQSNETESIEKDIARLESIKARVKSSSNSLSHDLNNENVDLINAVVKEKQLGSDRYEDDGVIKQPFRDIDIKFSVSPHILSFLKHFKVLGQISLNEETNNNKVSARSPSKIANDISDSSHWNHENIEDNRQNDEIRTTARARWERDRQTSYQRNPRRSSIEHEENASSRSNAYHYRNRPRNDSNERVANTDAVGERPSSAMSVIVPRGTATHFTAYPARPSSIPVDVMIDKTREHRENLHPYKYARAVPLNDPTQDTNVKRSTFEQAERDIEFSRRLPRTPVISERNQFLEKARRGFNSTTTPKNVKYPIVEIKDEDGRFGRSFAAVQINELNTSTDTDATQSEIHERTVQDIRVLNDSTEYEHAHGQRAYGSPSFERRPENRMTGTEPGRELNRSLSPGREQDRPMSPQGHHYKTAVDEVKGRRWVRKTAFASNGLGSKRLISGIACLSDGRVILVDQEQYTVQMYDGMFRFLYEIKLDSRPFDVVALSDNKIAVSLQSERVLKFFLVMDGALTPVADLGIPCDLVCYGFCRGGGNYFICCGDEIVVLSDQGRLVGRIKLDKTGKELFSRAEYVSTDRNGSIVYVSDIGCSRIVAVQVDGKKLWELGFAGFQPAGIKVVENYIYISDKGQHKIMLMSTDGHILKQSLLGRIENPCALCLNMSKSLMF